LQYRNALAGPATRLLGENLEKTLLLLRKRIKDLIYSPRHVGTDVLSERPQSGL
jgi:hypothetical protein